VTSILDAGDEAALEAARLLRAGRLVVLPTETVYGLFALATDRDALERVYEIKGRPRNKALALHLASPAALSRWTEPHPDLPRLAGMLPGPLMLLLRPTDETPPWICSDEGKVGVRVPDDPFTERVIADVDGPLVATSANLSGRPSPTEYAHVIEDLDGRVDLIVRAAAPLLGLESTVLDLDPPRILRAGFVTREHLAQVLGRPLEGTGAQASTASLDGLREALARGDTTLLVTRETAERLGEHPRIEVMGSRADLEGIAAGLFARLRDLQGRRVVVEALPEDGLGAALMERLRRYGVQF